MILQMVCPIDGQQNLTLREEYDIPLSPIGGHVQALGVSRRASAAEIKAQYKKLAMQYHPDKSDDPNVRVLMVIRAARLAALCLTNPELSIR